MSEILPHREITPRRTALAGWGTWIRTWIDGVRVYERAGGGLGTSIVETLSHQLIAPDVSVDSRAIRTVRTQKRFAPQS
jgi:hypothetical protein